MYHPLEVGNKLTHFSVILEMVDANLLDIPMAVDGSYDDRWFNMTDPYEIDQIMIMVPLSPQYTLHEIFGVLMDPLFFACLMGFSLLLSLAHVVIDYYADGVWRLMDILMSEKVFPRLMDQVFLIRTSEWWSHRIIFFLIGFTGLNLYAQFSGRMNSLFTSPPYHPQVRTFAELKRSQIKLLVDIADARKLGYFYSERNINAIYTNTSNFIEVRASLDNTYCYFVRTDSWSIFDEIQKYFSKKIFHVPDDLVLFSLAMWGFKLQFNSPFKEPLNYLIHQVRSYGLREAWRRSIVSDLLKLKEISLWEPNPTVERMYLTVDDLFWVWVMVAVGCSGGAVVFFVELCISRKRWRIFTCSQRRRDL